MTMLAILKHCAAGLALCMAGAAAAQSAPSVSLLFAGDIVLDGKAG